VLTKQRTMTWLFVSLLGLTTAAAHGGMAGDDGNRWSPEKAWDWYKQQFWLVGFNYIPATAINTTISP
jgi:hypothetical protein